MALLDFKLIFLIGLMYSQSIIAAKILIVTDQPTQQKAKEIKQVILATPPFSLLKDLTVVIRLISKDSASCTQPLIDQVKSTSDQNTQSKLENPLSPEITTSSQNGESTTDSDQTPPTPASCKKMFAQAAKAIGQNDSNKDSSPQAQPQEESDRQAAVIAQAQITDAQRLVVCDTSEALIDISGQENADRTIFVKESDTWAGSGGESITVTTKLPPAGAIHELLHSFGFGDEYEYVSPCEADTYCPYVATGYWGNIAVLPDLSPYASDASARQQHSSKIPWYSRIKPKTLITTGTVLGTPQKNEIGLHLAHVCDKAEIKVTSWKPGSEITVMEKLETGFIPEFYYAKIAESLGSSFDSLSASIDKGSGTNRNSGSSEKGVQ